MHAARGEGDPDRPLRLVQRGPRQDRVPQRPRVALRPAHADHLRHTLQLVAAGPRERRVFRADPQFPPQRLAAVLPVRRLARGVPELRRRARAFPAGARVGNPVPAARHHAAHGAPGLPERHAGVPGGELQRPRHLWGHPAAGPHAGPPALPGNRHPRAGRPGRRARELPPTLHHAAADRERVLRQDPTQAPHQDRRERGVEYVEVRLMDLDPFSPAGITLPVMRFLDVFLLHCLLSDSPPDSADEIACMSRNQECVAPRGREPGLRLGCGAELVDLHEWGEELLADCEPVAAALDAAQGSHAYGEALAQQAAVLRDPALTPSARMLVEMRRSYRGSYTDFIRDLSRKHRETLSKAEFPRKAEERFARMAEESLAKQRKIEAADTMPFEEFRKKYLAVERL